ncbi:hypothetical protein CC80DRAFT_254229 [Byssothecium circinans]|uniref:Cell wall protein-like protein n=1 Tax=Byssothecium circinans TaxID=147558 RepID=A0A6A5TAH5_9PLEO|nr:hypothetical protein CC80DRAFT_254229 [Byssothecium circinans]
MTRLSLLLAYTILTAASPNPARIPIPKVPSEPDVPIRPIPKVPSEPDIPIAPIPGIPGVNPGRIGDIPPAGQVPSNQVIQVNMGSLEQKLGQSSSERSGPGAKPPGNRKEEVLQRVSEAADVVVDVVEKILDLAGGEGDTTATTTARSGDFTPSTTLPSISFKACTSYAKMLSSCASATTSFYSLAPTVQASCACYSTPTTSRACTETKQAEVTGAPSLAIAAFDNNADACFSFFSLQGYSNVAKALDTETIVSNTTGVDPQVAGLGKGFCAKVDAAVKARSNGTWSTKQGLSASGKSMVWTDCKGLVTGEGASGGTGRGVSVGMGVIVVVLVVNMILVSVVG